MILALAGLALAACAPGVRVPGPASETPRIEGDALVAADGARLPLRRWLPVGDPGAVVLALHGFNDYGNAFDAPARALAERGIATFAYDQRGFGGGPEPGLWHGADGLVGDALAGLSALRVLYPDRPLFLLGESMGGAVATLALARPERPPIDGAILAAPAVWGWSSMNLGYRVGLWLMAHVVPGARLTGEGLDITPSDNEPMLRALGADPLVIKRTRVDAVYGLVTLMEEASRSRPPDDVPILVLYGRRDEIVPPDPVRRFVAGLAPMARLVLYEDGYHMLLRDLQAAIVYDDLARWIGEGTVALDPSREAAVETFLVPSEGCAPAASVLAFALGGRR